MQDLSKYSFVNAKIRAMLSYLISPSLFSHLLDAKDVYEVMDGLKQHHYYKDIAEDFAKEPGDLRLIEKAFLKNDLKLYRKVYEALSTKREKEFVSLFIQRYELEQIKLVLRLWHKKMPVDIGDYILDERIGFDIDFKKIIFSQTIEEIILLLDNTPYKKPLLDARDKFKERKSVFYLEVALDIDYYKRLISCIDGFSSVDKKIASKILGVQIDIENINWLIRLRKYYSLGTGEILTLIIPGGDKIHKDNVTNLYTSNGLSKIIDTVAFGPYVKIKDLIEENVNLIENFLYEILLREVKRVLTGFPFTIGTVLGYLVLKHSETKNIISLIYAKSYGWKKEEIGSLLNI